MDVELIRQKLKVLTAQITDIEALLNNVADATTASTKVQGPLYGIVPENVGLHVLKDKWCQKSYIKAQCDELVKPGVLQKTIETTRNLAPQRTIRQGFLLPDETRTPIDAITYGTERWLEAELYKLFNISNADETNCGLWRGICSRQVPLYNMASKSGWGEIDLLAVGNSGNPTVVELKLSKDRNAEPPQRPLIEGAAYAVALKTTWSSFWPEWDAVLSGIDLDGQEVNMAQNVDVVLLAPNSYWDHWLQQRQYQEAQASYRMLVSLFANEGIIIRFGGIVMSQNGKPTEVHERTDFLG